MTFNATSALAALSLSNLFAARLALDHAFEQSSLMQDIADLRHYPERITISYPDEWKSELRYFFKDHDLSFLHQTIDAGKRMENFNLLLAEINTAVEVCQSSNVMSFRPKLNSK